MTKDGGTKTGDGSPGLQSSVPGHPTSVSGPPSSISDHNMYKFQQLKVYKLALEYVNAMYELSGRLPESERFNLRSQLERAATSIVLNIAEGSTGQSDAEQNRFLGMALRSYLETIACLDIVERRGYLSSDVFAEVRQLGHQLFIKLQAFRRSLSGGQKTRDRGQNFRSSVASPPSPATGPRSLNPGLPSSVPGRRYP